MASSWSKLHHRAVRSPAMLDAIASAGGAALGLYCEALAFAGEHLTDGRLTPGQVGRMACHSPTAAQALINAGLWTESADGSLQIAGYLEEQESAADVRQRREDWTREQRQRRKLAAQQQRLARPGGPERQVQASSPSSKPAGPSDHVAPGRPCGVEWCDGLYHFSHDPVRGPKRAEDPIKGAQKSSWPCPHGPVASGRRSA